MKLSIVLLFLGTLTLMVEPLAAQEKTGFQVGGATVNAGAYVDTLYDSNYYFSAGTDDEPVEDVLSIVPGLELKAKSDTSGSQWSANAKAGWETFLLSDSVSNQGGVEGSLSAMLRFMLGDSVRFGPDLSLARSNGAVDELNRRSSDNYNFKAGVELGILPVEGKVFSQVFNYNYNYLFYEKIEGIDKGTHALASKTRWNFLPQTAVALMLNWRVVSYGEEARETQGEYVTDYQLQNSNSYPLRAKLGLTGLLLDRLSFSANVGYSYPFYSSGLNEHLFVGDASLEYKFVQGTRLGVGYNRDYNDTTFGNYAKFHKAYLSLGGDINWLLSYHGKVTGGLSDYVPSEGLELERVDWNGELDAGVDIRPLQELKISLGYTLKLNESSLNVVVQDATGGTREATSSYLKHIVKTTISYEY